MAEKKYDSSLARMAGNIASGILANPQIFRRDVIPTYTDLVRVAGAAVLTAKAIVAQLTEDAK